jgi:hypothetical protein
VRSFFFLHPSATGDKTANGRDRTEGGKGKGRPGDRKEEATAKRCQANGGVFVCASVEATMNGVRFEPKRAHAERKEQRSGE